MINKIKDMTDEEYEKYAFKRLQLVKEIDYISLLINTIHENGKCPFCHSSIESMDIIREKHLEKMREYNKFVGRKEYITHIEGNQEWKI